MRASWEFYNAQKELLCIVFSSVAAFYVYMTLSNEGYALTVKENKPY